MGSVLTVICAGILVAADPGASTLWDEYEGLAARIGRDASAQVRLALWCEEHGLRPQRHQHLAKALVIDSDNVLARGLSGFMDYKGRVAHPREGRRRGPQRRPAQAGAGRVQRPP